MPYPNSNSSSSPTQILLSLSTLPLLCVLVVSKALTELIKDLGLATEEVFRGDRLPVLKISTLTSNHSEDS